MVFLRRNEKHWMQDLFQYKSAHRENFQIDNSNIAIEVIGA